MKLLTLSFLLVSIVFIAGCTSGTTEPTATETQTQALITKSVDAMLPARSEIPTEWATGSTEVKALTEAGFVEGKRVSFFRELSDITGAGMDADFTVYRFSDSTSAKAYYDKRIAEIKATGGYKETGIAGCFAYQIDTGLEEEAESICLKSNIVYEIFIFNDYIAENPENELKDFTNLLKNKVSS